jgi:YfiH family protein
MEPFQMQRKAGQPGLFYITSWMQQFHGLTAGFTSRQGGVSQAPFSSMNCGLHVQDVSEDVIANRQRLADALHAPFESLVFAEQVHSNEGIVITVADKGKGTESRESAIQGKDSFITNEKGIVICALFADCVPLYFYDPINQAIGLAHAGWKGTVSNIAMATISLMTNTFGSKPKDIHAIIGPSIGVCCYEVDHAVASRVLELLDEIQAPASVQETVLLTKLNGKFMLNLQELNRNLLEQAGILSPHIEVTQLCTSCSTDLFFSHRKEGGKTGRMAAWIALSDE